MRVAMGSREQWLTVRDGFGLIYNGIYFSWVVWAHAFLLWLITGSPLPILLGCLVGVAGEAMCILGLVKLLAAPAESGFRGKIVWSVALMGAGTVHSLAMGAGLLNGDGEWQRILVHAVSHARLAADILFLLFVRHLGRYFGHYDMARTASSILKLNLTLIAVFGGGILAALGLGMPDTVYVFLWVVTMLIAWPVLVIRNMYLMRDARDMLTARVEMARFADAVMTEREPPPPTGRTGNTERPRKRPAGQAV